jgi:hypothetical protein
MKKVNINNKLINTVKNLNREKDILSNPIQEIVPIKESIMKNQIKTSIFLDEKTHEEFKIYCIRKKIKMKETIQNLISNFLSEKPENSLNL